ncbi:MAG: superoxide dismutase [Candidatus Marinimicrobia bacterium]|nr:superoxide dismutase [Candidatus Neomarinimicrobiota bacterium]
MLAGTAGLFLLSTTAGCSQESSGQSDEEISAAESDFTPDAFSNAAPRASLKYPYELPDLPYDFDALAPSIDARTMEIHHDRHHQGYTNNLNAALSGSADAQSLTIIELLSNLDSLPEDIRNAVRNNGGGYFNHALFWEVMSSEGGGQPTGELLEEIESQFDSFDNFTQQFSAAAGSVFGSGWAWLVRNSHGDLEIMQTANQDTPLALGAQPILNLDVWEHAYYLKYQNRRGEYISSFWDVVNWSKVEENFSMTT